MCKIEWKINPLRTSWDTQVYMKHENEDENWNIQMDEARRDMKNKADYIKNKSNTLYFTFMNFVLTFYQILN